MTNLKHGIGIVMGIVWIVVGCYVGAGLDWVVVGWIIGLYGAVILAINAVVLGWRAFLYVLRAIVSTVATAWRQP